MGLLETGGVNAYQPSTLDPDSAAWLDALRDGGTKRPAAEVRLYAMLLRIARREAYRRRAHLRVSGPELDDMAHQATADAVVAITSKLGQFRGESRFTTWAYKIVIFEVSNKIGRHFWRNSTVAMDAEAGTNRNAIYKMLFDARRKLRSWPVANGYLDTETQRTS